MSCIAIANQSLVPAQVRTLQESYPRVGARSQGVEGDRDGALVMPQDAIPQTCVATLRVRLVLRGHSLAIEEAWLCITLSMTGALHPFNRWRRLMLTRTRTWHRSTASMASRVSSFWPGNRMASCGRSTTRRGPVSNCHEIAFGLCQLLALARTVCSAEGTHR